MIVNIAVQPVPLYIILLNYSLTHAGLNWPKCLSLKVHCLGLGTSCLNPITALHMFLSSCLLLVPSHTGQSYPGLKQLLVPIPFHSLYLE